MAAGRAVLVAGLASLLCAAPAGAATQLGQTTPDAPSGCAPNIDNVQLSVTSGTPYEVPSPGVITSWSHRANTNPSSTGRLQIWRSAGGANYTLVDRSDLVVFAPGVLNTLATRISVQAGDLLGFRVGPAVTGCQFPGGVVLGTLAELAGSSDPEPGEIRSLSSSPGRLNVAASLEPDCDSDGLGDETQDADVLFCPPGSTATITRSPKDKVKTKKKRAKVTYEFIAGEPNSSFNCVLDGKQEFKACASPLTVKVKKGEHTFSVTATDAGGNAGAAATDTFKVKRKRRKR